MNRELGVSSLYLFYWMVFFLIVFMVIFFSNGCDLEIVRGMMGRIWRGTQVAQGGGLLNR